MSTLGEIESLAQGYAGALKVVDERLANLKTDIDHVEKRLMPGIESAAEDAAGRKELIRDAIEESPHLFVKPRTLVLFGIKVGFAKQRGEIDFADSNQVVALIQKHFPDQAEILIKTTKTPVKDALCALAAQDLKKIGVSVVESGDRVVVHAIAGEAEKVVDKIIGGKMTKPTKD